MAKNKSLIQYFFLALLVSMLISASTLYAETRWVEVEFDGDLTSSKITGVLFSNNTSFQIPNSQISLTQFGKTIVAIPYDSDIAADESLSAYAIASSEDGSIQYSSVVPALPNINSASGYSQPACIAKPVPSSMQSQMSLIANLLKIRGKRRANIKAQTEQTLSGEFLAKMQKYENGFGLSNDDTLSPDMPASEIVDRLNRILHTLRKVSSR